MTGNFIADDIPFKEIKELPEDIAQGLELHRLIDKSTDAHPAFKAARDRLRAYHKKYAPVVLDILNDHLLSLHWDEFFDVPETPFHEYAYTSLQRQVDRLPPKASLHVQTLLEHKYLHAYGSRIGLKNVLARIDKRTRFESDFASAEQQLYDDLDFFSLRFKVLFTYLLDQTKRTHA